MPNQIRFPYGDAFLVNTPHIDQLGNRIYQQEQQRRVYQQQQDKMLDDEFSKNLTGIRDSDIGDLTKAYGEFKQARMQTLNKPNISPEQQMDVLRKKANVYDIINQSKTQREWETAQGKQIMQDKKGMYADDAHQQLINRMKTPVTKINPENDSKLLYPYSMPDLAKELKIARGDEKEVPILLGQNPKDKFKDDKEIYKVGNNPNQFYNSLLQGVVAGNKGRNFTGIVNQKYNDAELEDLRTKYYAKVNDPKFIQVYGKPEPFPESANNTDLGKAVAIETMENVVNAPLNPKKVSELNQERVKADAHEFARQQQARSINAAIQRQRIGFDHTDTKDAKKQEENNQWIDSFIDDGIEKSKNYPLIDGVRTVPLDVVSGSALKKGQIPAVALSISENGQTFTPIYPTYENGNPTATPNPALSQPMDRSGIKLGLGYKTVSKKELGNVMNSGSDKDIKIQIGGKIYKVPKSNLSKLDSDKVKYKVIE